LYSEGIYIMTFTFSNITDTYQGVHIMDKEFIINATKCLARNPTQEVKCYITLAVIEYKK